MYLMTRKGLGSAETGCDSKLAIIIEQSRLMTLKKEKQSNVLFKGEKTVEILNNIKSWKEWRRVVGDRSVKG